MSAKKILIHNDRQFLIDIKRVREILVWSAGTTQFFKVRKMEVLEKADRCKINYYITDKIFVVKRNSMVII